MIFRLLSLIPSVVVEYTRPYSGDRVRVKNGRATVLYNVDAKKYEKEATRG